MADPALVEWIKVQIEEGHSEEDIKAVLASQGWSSEEINEAYREVIAKKEEPKPEVKVVERKSVLGLVFGILAGTLLLYDMLFVQEAVVKGIVDIFYLSTSFERPLLYIISGLVFITCSTLAYIKPKKVLGIVIDIFSLIYLLSGGSIIVVIFGLLSGIFVFVKR